MRNKKFLKLTVIITAALLLAGCTRRVVYDENAFAEREAESADEGSGDSAGYEVLADSAAYEDIPQTLTELEGYRPYIIRFLLNGEPSGDFVPYFNVDGELLGMEEAEDMGYIRNIRTYKTDGTPCKLMTVVNKDSGTVELTHNAVFVFYVKEGAEMIIYPASSADLMHFYGNLFELYSHYGAAEVEQKGWGASVLQYTLEPLVDFNDKGTVKLLDLELESYRTKMWEGNEFSLVHYFYFYQNFIEKETSAGSM